MKNSNKVWVSGPMHVDDVKQVSKSVNILIWLVSLMIVAVGVLITSHYDLQSSYSVAVAILTIILALVSVRYTNQGSRFVLFLKASRLELSKVVWPTRKETISVSVIVMALVAVFSIVIYIFGLLIAKLVQYLLS